MPVRIALFIFACLLCSSFAVAKISCVKTTGEAAIVENNISSAKAEAISRAKWAAIEQTSGVAIKAIHIVQNMTLIDESVSNITEGIVTSVELVEEAKDEDTFRVRLNVCVDTEKTVLSSASDSIMVIIKDKRRATSDNIYDSDEEWRQNYTSILTEAIIEGLSNKGYSVSDPNMNEAIYFSEVKDVLENNDLNNINRLLQKSAAKILLIGEIDYRVISDKGDYAGYGINMPLDIVAVRLSVQIFAKDGEGIVLLTSHSEQTKGAGRNVSFAAYNGLMILSKKVTPVILSEIEQCRNDLEKLIQIRVEGISDMKTHFEVKEILQNIAWVAKVDEQGIGEYIVSYSEKPVYLANSMAQKKGFQVLNFSDQIINALYIK